MTKKIIPFLINHSHRCAQVSLKCILSKKFQDRNFTLQELEYLTSHHSNEVTYPIQIAHALAVLDIDFKYYVKPNWITLLSSQSIFEKSLKDFYGNYAENILLATNQNALFTSASFLQGDKRVIESPIKPSIQSLEKNLEEGNIPICLINYDIYTNRPNKFKGHYLIITGYDSTNLFCHDSGPKGAAPDKPISKEAFQKAWNLCFFDHDLLTVKV
jgi:hypothetical protein